MIGGNGWSFSSVSSWRVTRGRIVTFAETDQRAAGELPTLLGQKIIAVEVQSKSVEVDPVFVLSDGRRIEIFSVDTYEPWTMQLPTGEVFVSSPSDEHAFD